MAKKRTTKATKGTELAVVTPSSETFVDWVGSTVRVGDELTNAYQNSPSYTLIQRATGYVMICAQLNAGVCASQKLRLYRPLRKGGEPVKGKRLRMLKDRNVVGRKAAEYAEYADDVEEVTDHPALTLLRNPNPWQIGTEFIEQAFLFMELAGNAYWWVFAEGKQYEAYAMMPQYVVPKPSDTNFIDGYYYNRDNTDPSLVPPNEVIHFKHKPHPLTPYFGYAPWEPALTEAGLANAATQAEMYRWLNGGRPDWIVEAKNITPEQRQIMKANLQRETRGVAKTGAFIILSNATMKPAGFPPKEMEYRAGMERTDTVIWNAMGVPESVMRMNDANLASSVSGNRQYLSQTIQPRCWRFSDYANGRLLPMVGVDAGEMWFAYDPIVPDDENAETQRVVSLVGAGIMDVDEARGCEGLEPRAKPEETEDADPIVPLPETAMPQIQTLVSQATSREIPVESARALAVATYPMLTEAQIGAIFDPIAALMAEKEAQAAQIAAQTEAAKGPDQGSETPQQPPEDDPTEPADDAGQTKAIKKLDSLDNTKTLAFYGHVPGCCDHKSPSMVDAPRSYEQAMNEFSGKLDAWMRSAIQVAERQAVAGGAVSPLDFASGELDAIIDAGIRSILGAAHTSELDAMGRTGTTQVIPQSVLRYLESYQVRLSESITADLADQLNNALAEGISRGMSGKEIADAIAAASPDMAGYRAERIARTEAATAYGEGRRAAWIDSGVTEKTWLLSGNPCEFCMALAAKYPDPIPIDQPFLSVGDTLIGATGNIMTVTFRDVQTPPLHPNDACAVQPVLGDDE